MTVMTNARSEGPAYGLRRLCLNIVPVKTIRRTRLRTPPLVFEHRSGEDDSMLWVADGVTWAAGAGAFWRELIVPILRFEREIAP
jgi:hypothetical protein